MADVITSQVRWYRADGTYQTTTKATHGPTTDHSLKDLIGFEGINMKPVTYCNIMIRRNGKLVSYKEFI